MPHESDGRGKDGPLFDTLLRPPMVVINYGFKKFPKLRRIGNDEDLEALSHTFEESRGYKCHFWNAPEKKDLLVPHNLEQWLLSNLNLQSTSDPSIPAIIFVILSHGDSGGKIFTEKLIDENQQPSDQTAEDFEYFINYEFCKALEALHWLKDTLKILFFGPCRGTLLETIDQSRQETRTNTFAHLLEPNTKNFVILFATVAETSAKREEAFNKLLGLGPGTWLVHALCQEMDGLQEDSTLENFLTRMMLEIHKWTLRVFSSGQTPEVKYYPHPKFIFKKLTSNKTDAIPGNRNNVEIETTAQKQDILYDWKSKEGNWLNKRRALIICNTKDRAALDMEQALSSKRFDTIILEVSRDGKFFNEFIDKVTDEEDDRSGCVLICVFTRIGSEGSQASNEEITFTLGRAQLPLKSIIGKFTEKKCTKWIGKPKLFFFLDESTTCDGDNPMERLHQESIVDYQRDSTKNSGVLVFVGCGSEMTQKVTQMISSSKLQIGGNLLEELTQIIRDANFSTGLPAVMPHVTSTLQNLLDFPNSSGEVFVDPILVSHLEPRNEVKWDEFKRMIVDAIPNGSSSQAVKARLLKNHVWLLSADAGMGKSACIDNLADWVNWKCLDYLIVHVKLQKNNLFLKKTKNPDLVTFLSNSLSCSDQVKLDKYLQANKLIIFMDGFDELFEEQKNKVLEFIKSTEAKMPLFVSSRLQDCSMIRNALPSTNLTELHIKRWSKEQQLEFMCQSTKQTEEQCNKKLDFFYGKVRLWNIVEIPFFMKNIDFESLEKIVTDNLFCLFSQIVKDKIEFEMIQKEKKSPEDEEFDEFYREREILIEKAALQLYDSGKHISSTIKERLRVIKTGIVNIGEDDSISFIHQLFAEYFVALYFIECISNTNNAHNVASEVGVTPKMILLDEKYTFCRSFIEAFFQEECNIKEFSNNQKLLSICGLSSADTSLQFMNIICTEGLGQCYALVTSYTEQFNKCEPTHCWANADLFKEHLKHYLLKSAIHGYCRNKKENIILILFEQACKWFQTRSFVEDVFMKIFSHDEQVKILNSVSELGYMKVIEKIIDGTGIIKTLINNGKITELYASNFVMDVKILRLYIANGLENNLNKYRSAGITYETILKSSVIKNSKLCFIELLELQKNHLQLPLDKLKLLHLAATYSRLPILKTLLDEGYIDNNEIMQQDGHGYTPLHCAVVDCNRWEHTQYETECLEYLASKKREALFLKDKKGLNVLQLSAVKGNVAGMNVCVELGMDIHDISDIFELMAICCDEKVLDYLIKKKVFDAKHRDKRGASLLHHSVGHFSVGLYDKIIKSGADVHVTCSLNIDKILNISVAFSNAGHNLIFKRLIETDSELPIVNDVSVLHISAHRTCAWDELEYFIAKGVDVLHEDSFGRTAFDWASYRGNIEIIVKLLHCTVAAANNIPELMSMALLALISNDSKVYCKFVSQGVDVNQKYCNSVTALHLACLKSNLDFLKILLKQGADVSVVDKNGRTPLHWAAQFGSVECFKFLLNNSSSETHNQFDIFGCNILHVATLKRDVDIATIAAEKVYDVNCKNLFGLTALHYSSWYIQPSLLILMLSLKGIDVDSQTKTGCTALHISAFFNYWWHVAFLSGMHANPELKNYEGFTPLEVAKWIHG